MTRLARYSDPTLQIIFSVTLVAVLGVSSITPAFPSVVRELRISSHSVGLLVTVFTLPGVILTPLFGVLADRYGRKKILIPALFLFGISGTWCFWARDFGLLLLLRFVQGVGAAPLGSLNLTVLGDSFSGRERTRAFGYNASVLSIGTAAYPSIGGALALFGWNYPFLLHLVAIPVALLVWLSLQSPEPPRTEQTLAAYLRESARLVFDRRVLALFASGTFTFILLYGPYLTFVPLWLAERFEVSSLWIGLMVSSSSVSSGLTATQLGRLSARFGERTLVRASYILFAISLGAIPLLPALGYVLFSTTCFGAAMGINTPTVPGLLTGLAPQGNRGVFMSLNGMVLRLGQTLGPLIMGGIFILGGMTGVFWGGVVIALIAFAVLQLFLAD